MRRSTRTTAHIAFLLGVSFPAAFLVLPQHAAAFEIFGIKLFGKDKAVEGDDIIGIPQPYDVTIETGEDSDAEKLIKSASSLWSGKSKPASGASGLIASARGDYRRLLDTFYADAHYGPEISITIDGKEASELLPDATLANPAQVRITVNPGPAFTFSRADIANRAPLATDPGDIVPDPTKNGFSSGMPARSGMVLSAARRSVEEWRQQGYPKATIAKENVVADHAANTIDAVLEVDSGRHANFGPVAVQGTERMDAAYVAWMSGIREGEEYDPDAIAAARTRLAKLDVFRAARFEEDEQISSDGTLPINLFVQERPLRRIGVGGTFSTIDGLGAEAFWLHRNLFGRAERLRLEAKVAGVGQTFDVTEMTYRLGATFTKPGVYTPDTDFVASVLADREVLKRYTRTGIALQAGFTHQFTEQVSGRLFANGSYNQFDDNYGTREFTTAGMLGGVTYDTRDNAADATRGLYLDLTAEPYYEFNYGNAAARVMAEARGYYSVDADSRFVLAGRVKVGSLIEPPTQETPPDKLFFAGGGGSVRGYAYRNIGVDTPGGVTGGRSLIEGSAELRTRVTPTIGVVAFADAGYVGADAIPDFAENLRTSVGVGLRYLTGFGPIRLDVATPLNKRNDDPSVAIYVGIGQSF